MAGDVNTVPLDAGSLHSDEDALRDDVHALIDRLPVEILAGIRPVLAKYATLPCSSTSTPRAGRKTILYPRGPCRRADWPG